MPRWEEYKYKFFSIILSTVSHIKEEKSSEPKPTGNQTDYATGKRVLTINKSEADVVMA